MSQLPPSVPPPENLTKELVQHLSKEIETTTNNMMAFRTRIGFSLCIGPFLLLGSLIVGAKGQPVTRLNWFYAGLALLVIAICYLGIAHITSEIELQALEQCNKWRELIGQLTTTQSSPPEAFLNVDLAWNSWFGGKLKSWIGPKFKSWFGREFNLYGVKVAYFVGYLLLFVAVAVAAVIISAGTPEPKNQADNGVNVRIEEVTPTLNTEQVKPTPQISPKSKTSR